MIISIFGCARRRGAGGAGRLSHHPCGLPPPARAAPQGERTAQPAPRQPAGTARSRGAERGGRARGANAGYSRHHVPAARPARPAPSGGPRPGRARCPTGSAPAHRRRCPGARAPLAARSRSGARGAPAAPRPRAQRRRRRGAAPRAGGAGPSIRAVNAPEDSPTMNWTEQRKRRARRRIARRSALLLLLVLAGLALLGLALGSEQAVSAGALVERPPETIWRVLLDLDGLPLWRSDLRAVE